MLIMAGIVVCLYLANVRQCFEMGGVAGGHVTTMRRWHG